EKMKCEFWICNDTPKVPAKPTIAWQLELDGKIVHAQRAPAEVKPVTVLFQGFTAIPVPEVTRRTPARLRLALFDDDTLLHDTSIDLKYFQNPPPLDVAVQIVGDAKGPAARLADELNLRVRSSSLSSAASGGEGRGEEVRAFLIDDYA